MLEAGRPDNAPDLAFICKNDNFGCRILSAYNTFGGDPSLVTMLAYADGAPVGALSLKGGSAVVCGAYNEEIADCLRFLGAREIFAPESFPPFDGVRESSRGPVAALQACAPVGFDKAERIDAETLREIYPVIVSDLPEIANQPFDAWYVELSHRLRHGNARILAVKDGGSIVATAMTAAETDAVAVIGFVRTLAAYRHRGYASGVCRLLGNELLQEHKTVYICCDAAVFPFYKKLGYRQIGNWWYGKL